MKERRVDKKEKTVRREVPPVLQRIKKEEQGEDPKQGKTIWHAEY